MSQHDYVIDNASGATVRADINSALAAIQSLNSGSSAPSSTVAGMLWLDTTGGVPYALKIRDAGNNHWLTLGNVTDPGSDGNLELLPGKINLPSSGGVFESDGSTEILTESSGAVSLKNTAIDSSVTMSANQSAVKTAVNASGSAPIFSVRAFVSFDGLNSFSPNPSTSAIRASGNVSSITDEQTGSYTVNFTTDIEDTDYTAVMYQNGQGGSDAFSFNNVGGGLTLRTESSLRFGCSNGSNLVDATLCDLIIVR